MAKNKIYQQIIDYVENNPGFIKYNNMHAIELDDCYAKMEAILNENSLNQNGTAHGGLMFGLADTAMGMAARTTGKNLVTINSQIDYLKMAKGSKLVAVAEKLKVGKTTAVFRCNIYDDKEVLVATATGTYFFLDDMKVG